MPLDCDLDSLRDRHNCARYFPSRKTVAVFQGPLMGFMGVVSQATPGTAAAVTRSLIPMMVARDTPYSRAS